MPETIGEWLITIFVVLPIATVITLYLATGLKAIVELSIEELKN